MVADPMPPGPDSPGPGSGRARIAERDGIVTPEAIRLDFAVAGLGSRTLAFCADLFVRLLVVYVLAIVVSLAGQVFGETALIAMGLSLGLVLLFGYPIVCETFLGGRTPGKMMLGLRVVTTEGAPVRFRHAAIRAALGVVDFIVFAGSIAVIAGLVTRQTQRLGDLAAGTIVIRERQATPMSNAITFTPPPGWEQFTVGLDVSRLDERQYVVLRGYLLRAFQMTPGARLQRGTELADRISARIGVASPYPHIPEAYLVSVAAAYQGFARLLPDRPPPPDPVPAPVGPSASGDPRAVWTAESLSPTWGSDPARP